MNWVSIIKKSIDYIEDNLHNNKNLNIENIAAQSNISPFYFQKAFNILTNETIAKYIRNRRLSLAGDEILTTDKKIIDLAFKYGYETPESFTRAFTRFHGATPTEVKLEAKGLKSYARLVIKISFEGGTPLDYKVIDQKRTWIIAKSRMCGKDSFEQNNVNLPKFWSGLYADGTMDRLRNLSEKNGIFNGANLGYRDNVGDEMRFSVGYEYVGGELSEDLSVIEIMGGKWISFALSGQTAQSMQQLWYRVYTEFMPFTSLTLKEHCTLELYTDNSNGNRSCELRIPLL